LAHNQEVEGSNPFSATENIAHKNGSEVRATYGVSIHTPGPVRVRLTAESSNGKTTDSESVNGGSTPPSASMPDKKDKKNEIKVEAELMVTASDGTQHIIRRFDRAWILAQTLSNEAKPVGIRLLRFARKEEK
jgi:hypothetical protein